MTATNPNEQVLIGVLASWDSEEKNWALADCFEQIYDTDRNRLGRFHFLFTGGTFDRLFLGGKVAWNPDSMGPLLRSPMREVVLASSTRLPDRRQGGVTVMANYLVNRQCSIIWPFLDPAEAHWLNPENLALTRLCDVWRVKRLRNSGSVVEWFGTEADKDVRRNLQRVPPPLKLSKEKLTEEEYTNGHLLPRSCQDAHDVAYARLPLPQEAIRPSTTTIALIAHDEMKPRLAEFAIEYESELGQFGRIFATRTTGREIEESVPSLKDRIVPVHSGPKGGDIQIATEILYRRCDVVIFFLDPMRPHPHADDIRVVLSACMVENNVRILTNEVEARDWMEEVVRRGRLPKAIDRIRSATLPHINRNMTR